MKHAHAIDASLVAEALRGDRNAFGALVKRYFSPAYAVALAHLGQHEAAQDAVQEAFLNAYRRLNTLREPARFREWLITIVRNACYSLRRKEHAAESVPLDTVAEPAELPDMERRELHALIRAKLAELDASPREALMLYYFSGQTQVEIAAMLGISEDAAQKRIARAREVLGQRLVDEVDAALGLPSEERKKREQRALAAIMAAPMPWRAAQEAAAGTAAAHASYSAYLFGGIAVLLLIAGVIAVYQSLPAASEPPEPSAPTRTDEAQPNDAPPAPAPAAVPSTPAPAAPASRWAKATPETSGNLEIKCLVVDERDRPVADIEVVLTVYGYAGEDPVGRVLLRKDTRTDENGWFTFEGLPYHSEQHLACDYILHAFDSNACAWLRLYYDNVFESKRLRLTSAGPISGQVVDEAGVAIASAMVYPAKSTVIEHIGTAEMAAWAVVSDAAGRFTFPALPKGAWTLAVVDEGHAMAVLEDVQTASDTSRIVMKGRDTSGSIQGEVRDQGIGSPLPGVWVVLDHAPVRWLHRKWVQTDAQGMYRFDTLGAGPHTVEVEDPAWAMQSQSPVVNLAEGQHAEAIIEVAGAAMINGRVFREDTGEGVGGVTLFVSPRSSDLYGWFASDQVVRRAVTNANGEYAVDGLRPVEVYVQCGTLPGTLAVARDFPSARLEAGQTITVDFPVIEGIAVGGRVVGEEGNPIGMAKVDFYSPSLSGMRETVTDDTGFFTILGVKSALTDLELTARKAGWAMKPNQRVAVPGTGTDAIVLTMAPERCVSGTVKNRIGKPVEGAGIMPVAPDSLMHAGGVTNSDAQGRFFLGGLYPGEYLFAVTPPDSMRYGGTDRQGPFAIEKGMTEGIELQFDTESNLTIAGTIRDTNGKLVNAEVTAAGPVDARDTTFQYTGHFTLRGLAPGVYDLTAWRAGVEARIEDVVAGSEGVEIVIDAAAGVLGRVVDADSGAPIIRYHIGYVARDAESGRTLWNRPPSPISDAGGAFRFDDDVNSVPAGEITLQVLADGYAAAAVPLGVLNPGEVRADIDVRLARSDALAGRVTDPQGKPVAGATIMARVREADGPPPTTVQSDAAGGFNVTSIAPEHDLLVVTHPDHAGAIMELPLPRPTVVLSSGGAVAGRVLLNGEPQLAAVRWENEASILSGGAYCNEDGTFRLDHIPPGDVEIRAYFRSDGTPSLELSRLVTVQEGMVSEADLTGNLGNKGVILEPAADAAVSQSVRIVQVNPDGITQSTRLFPAEGRNRIDTLLAGPTTVEFIGPDGSEVVSSSELVLESDPKTITRITLE